MKKKPYSRKYYYKTIDGRIFYTDKGLAKWLRERGTDPDNDLSDDFLINEAYNLEEFEQVKSKRK